MVALAHGFTIDGLQARHVAVEVDVRAGLPAFTIVGLADVAVREARERIQTAIRNSGFHWPARRITANLAPGDLRKAGPGLDLALACAILAATGELPATHLDRFALFGELSLNGRIRPAHGTLAVADAARRLGLQMLATAPEAAREAALVEGLRAAPIPDLAAAGRMLRGLPIASVTPAPPGPVKRQAHPDLADVVGRGEAVRALIVAAAGGHNLLLSGPPGVGKTMLVRRLPGILPAPDREEALELARLQSVCSGRIEALPCERPFRAPHHTSTAAGLIGGAGSRRAGEVVLAHRGVLFLDELSEFPRPTLEALRQPLEDGCVTIARGAGRSVTYPARVMLVCATNPCPCGYAGEPGRCRCSESDLARQRRRLSGPLLDRLDMLATMPLERGRERAPTSAEARTSIAEARARQARRLGPDGIRVNAEMDAAAVARHVSLDDHGSALLAQARTRGLLSARGEHRTLQVARTIADLAGAESVRADHLGAALALRCELREGLMRTPA